MTEIARLSVVYDADGTVTGEVRYFVGRYFLGDRKCSLCDISHGPVKQKAAWKEWTRSIRIPVAALHRDSLPYDVAKAAAGVFPVVVAHGADDTTWVIVGRDQLTACAGDVAAFAALIDPILAASRSTRQ